jgi:hypothetical protein
LKALFWDRYQHFCTDIKWNVYAVAITAVVSQRFVMVLLTAWLAPLFGLPGPLAAFGLLLQGLPGVILLVILVPTLIKYIPPIQERTDVET